MTHRILATFILGLTGCATLFAHGEDADFMRSMGKMYVVVAVLATIFILMIGYLVYLDRKTRRLEKQIENEG